MSDQFAISSDFLSAQTRLPRNVQGRITEMIHKFRQSPKSSGSHLERIRGCEDKNLFSIRINDAYRAIMAKHTEEQNTVYLLLWADRHDEAYAWASRKRCSVNPATGAIQVYTVLNTEVSEFEIPADSTSLFGAFKEKELLDIGVPKDLLPLIKRLKTKEDFYAVSDQLPADVHENLGWLVEGIPYSEVLEMVNAEHSGQKVTGSMADALNCPATLKSFFVVTGEDELREIMAAPLEKWRVFLHSAQRKIVQKDYSGPAQVLGSAGTGKTVVAMHRAKQLASHLQGKEKLLFTTFTTNLASDIRYNLAKICTTEEMNHIEVMNLDSWVEHFLQKQEFKTKLIYGETLNQYWETAVAQADPSLEFPVSFYQEEWIRVVMAQEALTMEKYAMAPRVGRGTRLDRRKKMLIWKVFEIYRNLLKRDFVRDIQTAMYECKVLLENQRTERIYQHIVVDEGQDFSANAYRLLRTLAGPEHKNDIFIVGDSHQRIYQNRAVLSQCGINIRGRSSTLKINYRTTEETRKFAFSLLKGISFDNLDGETIPNDRCQSLTHGNKPQVLNFGDFTQESDFICEEILKLQQAGTSIESICIVVRTNYLVKKYVAALASHGIPSYEIHKSKVDKRNEEGVRVATIHRVKGLEFQYIFIASVNHNTLPVPFPKKMTDSIARQEHLTAEKCLLYVALTRAQKGAYITSYGKCSEFLESL
ncbi:MAG: AAA family ATPase [Thermoguttaceae bacterium]|nr:AAA family ATPase [Thermoguttaceae bacterium]